MPTPVRQTRVPAERVPPLGVVVQARGSVVRSRRSEPGSGGTTRRPARVRAAAPLHDRDAPVAVADEGRVAVLQRLVHATVVGRAVMAVDVGEAAVEGRQQPPSAGRPGPSSARARPHAAARNGPGSTRAWCACGRTRRRTRRARIVEFRPECRHQHRWATIDRRAGRLPDPFARKRVPEYRLDRRRPAAGVGRCLRGCPTAGRFVSGGPPFFGAFEV